MNEEKKEYKIALADDHMLIRKGIAGLINDFDEYKVIIEAATGEELLNTMRGGLVPDIVLLDLNMPGMGGRETAMQLYEDFPIVNILMLSMYDTEISMIQLLKAGVRGFLKKDVTPTELKLALNAVIHTGYYHSHNTTGKLVNVFRKSRENFSLMSMMLNETEINFLRLTCTEYTYKGIANEMGLNPRTIDNLRDSLFEKLDVKSRIGLAMYAIRHGIATF